MNYHDCAILHSTTAKQVESNHVHTRQNDYILSTFAQAEYEALCRKVSPAHNLLRRIGCAGFISDCSKVNDMQHCTECYSELPPDARFCIECSAPVYATGKTERLNKDVPGKLITYEGDAITVTRFIPDKPLGRLNGEWIYEYSYEVWSDPNFMVMPDPRTFIK